MDEIDSIANKIKSNYDKTKNIDCETIIINLAESLKKLGDEYNPKKKKYSQTFNIIGNGENYKDISKTCSIDLKKYEKKLNEITNLDFKINIYSLETSKEDYNKLNISFWIIKEKIE